MLASVVVAAVGPLVNGVHAEQYSSGSFTWDDGSTAAWSPTSGGSYDQLWMSGNDAIFEGSAGTVSVAAAGATAHNLSFGITGYTIQDNTLTLTGSGPTITLNGGLSATIASAITGSAGLVKSGDGVLTLTGWNTVSGGTTVNAGTLEIGDGSVDGTLNGTYDITAGATLKLNRATPTAITSDFTGGGTLILAFANSAQDWGQAALSPAFSGKVSLTGGRLWGNSSGNLGGATAIEVNDGCQFLTYPYVGGTYTQTLSLRGERVDPDGYGGALRLEESTWAGPVILLGNAVIANHLNSTAKISGVISGAYNLTITKRDDVKPANLLILTASNTYSGATALLAATPQQNGPHVQLGDGTEGHDGSLNTSGITMDGSLTYKLFGDQTVSYPITGPKNCKLFKDGQGTLTLNNTGAVGFGNDGSSVSVLKGRLVYTNLPDGNGLYQTSIAIASEAVLEMNVDAGRANCFGAWDSTYTGQGTLRKTGDGVLNIGIYGGANGRFVNFGAGALIDIQGGTFMNDNLRCHWQNNMGSVAVSNNATFDIRGEDVRIDSLLGAGTVLNSYAAKTLTLGVADGSGTFNGVIQDGDGSISQVKAGSGTQVLGGLNSYTGPTVVSLGTLAVNGTLAAASAVTVYTNATLAGTGTIGGAVTTDNGATLSPGDPSASDTIGTLTFSQTPTLNDETTLQIDVSVDGRCDVLNIQGNVELSNLTVNVADLGLLDRAKSYTILTCTGTRQGTVKASNLVAPWYVNYSDPTTLKIDYPRGTLIRFY
jgi:fibronectin-binding autotransporter adhesin